MTIKVWLDRMGNPEFIFTHTIREDYLVTWWEYRCKGWQLSESPERDTDADL